MKNDRDIKRKNFFEEAKKGEVEAIVCILRYVKLENLNPRIVKEAFEIAYKQLIEKEEYEMCAELRDIEKEYKKKLLNKPT